MAAKTLLAYPGRVVVALAAKRCLCLYTIVVLGETLPAPLILLPTAELGR